MSLVPSKLGADPKKIAILGGLVLLAAYFYFSNSNSGGGSGSTPVVSRAPLATPATAPRTARSTFRQSQQASGNAKEFKPSLKPKNIDTASIDPTLRLDLLAKLKTVDLQGSTRSLFEISAAPPEEIKAAGLKEPAKIAIAPKMVGPVMEKPPEPAPEPKAPPIPLKFYGFVNKTKVGDKRAFFLDGEDIVIAAEGDTIKKRYKIVRIGVNSAVVEDTEFKSNNQQTLPLEAELAG
jgi:hypothetical protein